MISIPLLLRPGIRRALTLLATYAPKVWNFRKPTTKSGLTLHRVNQSEFATYGTLVGPDGALRAVTLERPWLNNARDVSCIPAGTYRCARVMSPSRGYEVFELQNVPGREAIQLHIGNLPGDSHGCILLGTAFGTVDGKPGITGSRAAFEAFMASTKESFELTVTDEASRREGAAAGG